VFVDAVDLITASFLINEISEKYGTHISNTSYHNSSDISNKVSEEKIFNPIAPSWQKIDENGTSNVSLVTIGLTDALRYESPPGVETVYFNEINVPVDSDIMEFRVNVRINDFDYSPNVDTKIALGIVSNDEKNLILALGFDAINNIPYVKIFNVKTTEILLRVPFNWADGDFHTYVIRKDDSNFSLVVEQ
jgi:hypothetical protein